MQISDWISIGELIVAVIEIITGVIVSKGVHEVKKVKNQIGELYAKIDKIEINNSQMAQIINNNQGLDYVNTKQVVDDVIAPKMENVPKLYYQNAEPQVPDGEQAIRLGTGEE